MIRSFYIDNFKSLVDFRLPPLPHRLSGFTCLVGLNGAGKSTVLQAFDFVGHMTSGQVSAWLRQRDWDDADLKSRFLNRVLINFELELELPGIGTIEWHGAYNATLRRCTSESVRLGDEDVLKMSEDSIIASGRDGSATLVIPRQGVQYEGSVLSLLDTRRSLHPALQALKASAGALRSLDMLNPREMRRRSRDAADIGYGGERLSGYLHGLSKSSKDALLAALQEFYPQLKSLTTTGMRAGWRDLRIAESYADAQRRPLDTPARQVNDGLLRILAVLSQVTAVSRAAPTPASDDSAVEAGAPCVLFDEIENGINPELMQKLVQLLLGAKRQVIVTTHSPLVLNYLPDVVAKESVLLLFRNSAGHTKAVRLFDLPSTQKRLALLGPGEVFVDTNLEALPAEAMALLDAQAS
jgi:predicted ATPase